MNGAWGKCAAYLEEANGSRKGHTCASTSAHPAEPDAYASGPVARCELLRPTSAAMSRLRLQSHLTCPPPLTVRPLPSPLQPLALGYRCIRWLGFSSYVGPAPSPAGPAPAA